MMLPPGVRIFVCVEPVDLRRGFDTLMASAREKVREDPMSGGLFVFTGKRATRAKVLWVDRHRCCLLWIRLQGALFRFPDGEGAVRVDAAQLAKILDGVPREKR